LDQGCALTADSLRAFPGKGVMEARAGRDRAAAQGGCQAQMERDILKIAAVFFAKESM
jgi:transposase